jgi:hypothetical protein
MMCDYLMEENIKVIPVRTHLAGAKAEVIEALSSDVEHARIKVCARELEETRDGGLAGQLQHEMLFFTSTRKTRGGQEWIVYEGPQVEGEHDDCVISLALANWARIYGATVDPLEGDLSGFIEPFKESESPVTTEGFGGFGATIQRSVECLILCCILICRVLLWLYQLWVPSTGLVLR